MLIVTISFGIGLMIYMNLMRASNARQVMHAGLLLNELAIATRAEQRFLDEEIRMENIVVEKTITPFNGSKWVQVLYLKARGQDGKTLAERQELIFIPGS